MKLELWELESYANQALKDYEDMANEAMKSRKPALASYYDGVRKGIDEILSYIQWNEEAE